MENLERWSYIDTPNLANINFSVQKITLFNDGERPLQFGGALERCTDINLRPGHCCIDTRTTTLVQQAISPLKSFHC